VDFTLDETQATAAAVARETMAREPTESAWKALAQSGLLSLALPVRLGGEGLGALEIAAVLTEVGRAAAQLPALHTLALGVLQIVRFGTDRQQDELLPEVASGDRVLTAALRSGPATVDGDRLHGSWVGVGYAATAYRILVPATAGVFLVDPRSPGVSLIRTPTSSGAPEFTVRLDGASGEPLGGTPAELRRIAVAGACAVGNGLVAGALELTAAHVRTREQFGKPLATFQAVAQQVADVYITSRTLNVATWSGIWRQDGDLAVAAYWLAEEAPKAMQICHHLHGGLGVDVTYPMHRYYSMTKDLVRFLGGAEYRLGELACTSS
jgi:3-oxo-4-pregnene-20-carboxyl-CoA dehydrogenase alpha subunit